jgi:hypothetical protein
MLPTFAPGLSARAADRALKAAFAAEDEARKCAVPWFGEILRRELYRDLGYSSMAQYARRELGFSETRISDFMRLARKLEDLPAVKAALPQIGYTKAREIVDVASPRTEERWVAVAKAGTRAQLTARVKQAKAQSKRFGTALFPEDNAADLAAEVPVRVALEFTPEQHARWDALWEKLAAGRVSGGRVEVLLEAMANLVDVSVDFPRG